MNDIPIILGDMSIDGGNHLAAALLPCPKCGYENPREAQETVVDREAERCVVCPACHFSSGFFPNRRLANRYWNVVCQRQNNDKP